MIELQLPTMITCFIKLLSSTPLLYICLFPTSVPVYPGFNFKINYLNSSPCFRVLLGRFNLKQVVKFTCMFALRSIPYTLSVQPCISGNYISWAPLPVDIQLVWALGASGKRTRAGREKKLGYLHFSHSECCHFQQQLCFSWFSPEGIASVWPQVPPGNLYHGYMTIPAPSF